ncbi:MAG: DNA-processing protein DprA [Stellaceae bacterium]
MKTDPRRITSDDVVYPPSLRPVFGALVSPEIWYLGNIDLVNAKAVGFCGSRNASEYGLQIAADCASQLSAAGVTVVSGYAPGVDMASHNAALKGGGKTIVVLPEGIDYFRIKKNIVEAWDWERVLVLSQFPRRAIWRADRAMERNKVIVALSEVVIVLEARERGGTLNAGYSTLSMNKPLFVALYDDMNGAREGNQLLIQEGGIPLRRNRSTNQAQLREVFDVLGLHGDDRRAAPSGRPI